MRFTKLVFAIAFVVAITSCSSKTKESNNQSEGATENVALGPQRMQVSNTTGNASIGNNTYSYTIIRTPADSLSTITDDQGIKYVDNVITLRITNAETGNSITSKTYTKKNFANYVDHGLLSRSILLGLVFDKVEDGKMKFVASVGDPVMDDLYQLMDVIVSTGGTISIQKSSVAEEVPNDTIDAGV